MMFRVGDRILATGGVCPGHYGVVDAVKCLDTTNPKNTTYSVTYDSGRKDTIYGYMLALVDRGEEYDIDE